jgi:hypothetical protein
MSSDFFVGLDLGQAQDFTALAVLERPLVEGSEESSYALRHLVRWPLGTPYTAIVPAVARLVAAAPLSGSDLVADQTGVGRALVDMLRAALVSRVLPVTITGGHAVSMTPDGSFHVPKKELVTCLQMLLQGRRLQIARGLPQARTLTRELQNFQVRITAAANETFGVWREGQHDDLVLAVALACWWAERSPRWGPDACTGGGKTLVSQAPPGVFLTEEPPGFHD